ncbi:MAG: hypothetical protein J6W00_14680, partial [Lentisphaeria bacterium]|nr:hypothetical protein [Lentisphaeria bacterium]
KVGESAFDKAIGGRGVQIYRGVSGFYSQCDELAMFDYAKYTADFTPPAAPYNDIVSGLNQNENPPREVKVSGCINRFVNDPSFALVDPNATGYNRIWVTFDGKYYIFCSWDYCAWIIANKTDFFQFDFVCYARLNVASGEDWMEVEPIGHGGWIEEGTNQPISVVYNS